MDFEQRRIAAKRQREAQREINKADKDARLARARDKHARRGRAQREVNGGTHQEKTKGRRGAKNR